MCILFSKLSQLSYRGLRNTATDLRIPKKSSKNGQNAFHLEVPNYGMASRQKASKRYYNLFFGSFKRIFIVNNPVTYTF